MNTLRKLLLSLGLLIVGGLPASAFDNWVACANGNFDTAATWCKVDAAVYTNSEAANTALTTSFQASTAAQPGALTVQAIAVKIASRAASPTGSMTCDLFNSTGSVEIDVVTVSVSDIPTASTTANEGGWFVMQLPSSHLLIAATNYQVRCLTSNAAQVNLYSVSGTNWAQMMVTTTTGSPATADNMVIGAWWTAAATNTLFTVTMDHSSATAIGTGTAAIAPLAVSDPIIAVVKGGTLAYSIAASTQLRLAGNVIVYNGGVLSLGTSGSPVPTTNTAQLQFTCVSDGDYGLIFRNGSTANITGAPRSAGKLVVKTLLTADAAINATTLTVANDTGWLSGDKIALAGTNRTTDTGTQNEAGTLNGAAGASSLTVNGFAGAGGGIAKAHSGTSPTQGEVINYTRNVQINSTSASAGAYLYVGRTAVVAIAWTEFSNFGANSAGKQSIYTDTTTGSFSLTYSAIHDTRNYGILLAGTQPITANVTVQHNVFWNIATQNGIAIDLVTPATTTAAWLIDDNTIIQVVASYGVLLADVTGTFTNNTIVGAHTYGFGTTATQTIGTWSGNIFHSNNADGMQLAGAGLSGTMTGGSVWRNSGAGDGIFFQSPSNLVLDGIAVFGNLFNITLGTSQNLTLKNCTANGDTTASSNMAVQLDSGTFNLLIDNCQFSVVSGIKTQMASDIVAGSGGVNINGRITIRNSILNGTTPVTQTSFTPDSFVGAESFGQTAGDNRAWIGNLGILNTDSVITNLTSPSMRMTPVNGATGKLTSGSSGNWSGVKVPVASGATVSVGVWVRESVSTDASGVNYTGSAPRLMQRANPALGQNSDVPVATFSGSLGTWTLVSGTSSTATANGAWEFFVDCDGTGTNNAWINTGDWNTTTGPSNPNGGYWFNGFSFPAVVPSTGGGRIIGGFLLKRDLNHPANDNSLMWLNKVA